MIPKPDGSQRELGIPTVTDRLIQQVLLQVLQPLIDPTFSEHSHGFRLGRRAQDAVKAARCNVQQGKRVVVDVDLSKFFDRVNHDIQFKNDETGASAYDPRVMLKIVLLAYSQGMISSRSIERACARNVQFIAISGDSQPSHSHVAKFVANLGEHIKPLCSQVLLTCDAQGLIGRHRWRKAALECQQRAQRRP